MPLKSEGTLYSAWKAAHFPEKLAAIKRGELVAPQHIAVDLTGRCNHNCRMCFYRNAGFTQLQHIPTQELPLKIGCRLFDDMADLGIPALELTGGGEPLLYPEIERVLDRISKRDLELAIVTNGSLLTKPLLDRITRLKWIRFSVDAGTAATYDTIHRAKNFDTLLTNIERVVDKGFPDCEVGVSFVIQPQNISEIYSAADIAKNLGASNIRFTYAYTSAYERLLNASERALTRNLLREARSLEDSKFKVFVMDTRLDDFAKGAKPFSFCGSQLFTVQIGCDGLVYPCCIVKYQPSFAIGDVVKWPLKEILFGEQRKRQIAKFDVQGCPPCWLKGKNQFIEYLLSESPRHVNYV